jgi:hypothetical protein
MRTLIVAMFVFAATAAWAVEPDRYLYERHAGGSRTVVIDRSGVQHGVVYDHGVIADRFTVYDPRRAARPVGVPPSR